MNDYFAFGNVAIDDLVFADGTTRWAVPGGGALYAALGMAVWTRRAAVIAPFGPDYPCERFRAVDFRTRVVLAHTMRNWGLYEADGARHFVARRDSLPWEAFSPTADALAAPAYRFCHIAPLPWAAVANLIDALRARNASLIALDLHDRELAAHDFAQIRTLLARIQLFLPSRQDVAVMFPGQSPAAALRSLRQQLTGLRVIGVKCDADGVLVHSAGAAVVTRVPSAASAVIDATGAGDAFCGGFLAGYAQTGDAIEAAVCGSVSASFALAEVGPAGLIDAPRGEAERRAAALRSRITHEPF